MTYPQTLDYLFARLPMYQRVGAAAYKANLDNTYKIVELLGKPHQKLNCIHVAGTNGKGSSSHMLAAILQQSGYKTGLYTSPHLVDFRERIKINGKMIPKNYVTDFVIKHKSAFEEIAPSFFEWTFGLALDYFKNQEVDVAVIEVGLGGRLDSTNIITPKAALITNISFDHMNLLGDTLEKIGREKAGIIKPRIPIVISQYQSETAPLFNTIAKELKAPIEFADKNYKLLTTNLSNGLLQVKVLNKQTNQSENYDLDLTGNYQAKNLLGVLNVIHFIEKSGFLIQLENLKIALKQVAKLTGLMGRWQTLSKKPLIIADTGHNEDGIKQVIDNFATIPHETLHIVFGVVNDKDITKILTLLPKLATYYFVKANVPRALNEQELMKEAKKLKLHGNAYATVEAGLKAAKKACKKNDLIFVGGSTFVVGDALELYKD
jgi:dihydrofolate synthase/folylpolyglutamate synthase